MGYNYNGIFYALQDLLKSGRIDFTTYTVYCKQLIQMQLRETRRDSFGSTGAHANQGRYQRQQYESAADAYARMAQQRAMDDYYRKFTGGQRQQFYSTQPPDQPTGWHFPASNKMEKRFPKLDFNKMKWKAQFAVTDIAVVDMLQLTGRDVLIAVVPGFFRIEIPVNFEIHAALGEKRFELLRGHRGVNLMFAGYLLKHGYIPQPMEELA